MGMEEARVIWLVAYPMERGYPGCCPLHHINQFQYTFGRFNNTGSVFRAVSYCSQP
jgi:hypothetical protein